VLGIQQIGVCFLFTFNNKRARGLNADAFVLIFIIIGLPATHPTGILKKALIIRVQVKIYKPFVSPKICIKSQFVSP